MDITNLTAPNLMLGVTINGVAGTGKVPLSYLATEAGTYVNAAG